MPQQHEKKLEYGLTVIPIEQPLLLMVIKLHIYLAEPAKIIHAAGQQIDHMYLLC